MIRVAGTDHHGRDFLHKPRRVVAQTERDVPVQARRRVVGTRHNVRDVDVQILVLVELPDRPVEFVHHLFLFLGKLRIGKICRLDGHGAVPGDDFKAFFLKKCLPGSHDRRVGAHVLLDHVEIDSSVFLRRNREQVLCIPDQRNRAVCDIFCPSAVLLTADNGKGLFAGHQLSFLLLLRKLQGSLESKNTRDGFVQAFHGQIAVINRFPHPGPVFIQVLVEQNHVAAGHNRGRKCFLPGHDGHIADHRRRVGGDHAVEAKAPAKQAGQQLLRERRGIQLFFIRCFRIQCFDNGRQRNMADHHGLGALIDQRLIDFAVGIHPFLVGAGIDAGHDVLVALVHSVSGEVLDGNRHARFLRAAQIRTAHRDDPVAVTAEGPDIGDRAVELPVNIHNRGKRPVQACCRALRTGGIAHLISGLGIICRRNGQRLAERRAFHAQTVSAGFRVRRDQHRNLCEGLNLFMCRAHLCLRPRPVHQSADMQIIDQMMQIIFVIRQAQRTEQLTHLLIRAHAGQRLFHPPDVFVRQKERLSLKINHCRTPFYFVMCRPDYGRLSAFSYPSHYSKTSI